MHLRHALWHARCQLCGLQPVDRMFGGFMTSTLHTWSSIILSRPAVYCSASCSMQACPKAQGSLCFQRSSSPAPLSRHPKQCLTQALSDEPKLRRSQPCAPPLADILSGENENNRIQGCNLSTSLTLPPAPCRWEGLGRGSCTAATACPGATGSRAATPCSPQSLQEPPLGL